MGYEVCYHYHPKKEEGVGYDTSQVKTLVSKVGKPFDETPLEKLAGHVMSQMARRDILIIDVEIDEFVRRNVSFKESKDGRGIVLKNKRFSFASTGEMISSEIQEISDVQIADSVNLQPHELVHAEHYKKNLMESMYSNPNVVSVQKRNPAEKYKINPNKVLYWVYFEPELIHEKEAKNRGFKFTRDKKYPVHHIVEHPTGKIDLQKLVITDDSGRLIEAEDKYFTAAGMGLSQGFETDQQSEKYNKKVRLSYDNELVVDPRDVKYGSPGDIVPMQQGGAMFHNEIDIRAPRGRQMDIPLDIPIDDGTIPDELLEIPDIRQGRGRRVI